MTSHMTIHYWVFLPEAWVIFGILLIAAELFDGNMIALPLGIAALAIALLVYGQSALWFNDTVLFETWRQVLMIYAGIAVIMVAIIRFVFQRRRKAEEEDVNDY
ncbi:hypothetical protein [Nisaea sp.]|uniref:NfeD family protein n=1 Tax=Nisaea sp. TaxID=2024842 RepID=UPI002B276E94|nr:hypothetical protein [Nisaea sp.]